ncbi:MAG: hypothetical protein H0V98_02030 [Chloroflexia bacterium]|nr:hypothetical protein [Chloroflexia bacterium]
MSGDAFSQPADRATGDLPGDSGPAMALPAPLTPLIGREREVREVLRLLDGDETRILTLMGLGGVGKTRLAIEVARSIEAEFSDGVRYFPLASIRDPEQVLPSVARALGITARADLSLWDMLTSTLRNQHFLVVLDNFEHLLGEAPTWLVSLLGVCPRIKVLTTSRIALSIYGEHRYLVPPLPVPETGAESVAEVLETHAVRLFVQRARSINTDFSIDETNARTIGQICRKLDGLPLAIELAAARVNVLALGEIRARLNDRFALLSAGQRDAPTRQQSMRDAIAWSYELLSPEEQRFFRHLTVFVGGFTLEAAEAVCSTDDGFSSDAFSGIASLVNHSLIRRVDRKTDRLRFRMLETIREFGAEQLGASEEQDLVRSRHAAWCLDLASTDASEFHPFEHVEHVAQLESEHANLRAALTWLDTSGHQADLAELVAKLRWLWYLGEYWSEGVYWLERVLAESRSLSATLQCDLERSAGQILHVNGSGNAIGYLERSLVTAREIDDVHRQAEVVFQVALIAEDSGNYADAQAGFETARDLYVRVEDAWSQYVCDYHLGVIAYGTGDMEAARAMLEASSEAATQMGDLLLPIWVRNYLILIACDQGRNELATTLFVEQRAELGKSRGFRDFSLLVAAVFATASGRHLRANRLFGAVDAERRGVPMELPEADTMRRYVEQSRQSVGNEEFERAWLEGHGMRANDLDAEIEKVLAGVEERLPAPVMLDQNATGLSPRELDVLRLMADGMSNQEISDVLYISVRTTTSHATSILAKLNLRSRTAAVAYAIRNGLA